jgi:hypothetical protein
VAILLIPHVFLESFLLQLGRDSKDAFLVRKNEFGNDDEEDILFGKIASVTPLNSDVLVATSMYDEIL